ncbi:MAG: hypothetical protein ACJAS1_001520 [Oleiphilaceae bacterium]|jgi:hypothetical protein
MIGQDPLAHLCPLCREPNSCQQVELSEKLTKGCDSKACWCFSVQLDEQTRQSLNSQTNGKRCLCQTCIQEMAHSQQ